MKLARHKLAFLSATALGLGIGPPMFAQTEAEFGGEEIIVTARRVEERLQDVPISITVFNQEGINNRNIVNAADLTVYDSVPVNEPRMWGFRLKYRFGD